MLHPARFSSSGVRSERRPEGAWLFSRTIDPSLFLGSFGLAMAILVVGHLTGDVTGNAPDWVWVPCVLMVDVAHVWATGFITYFDLREVRRRPWLYGLVPCLGLGASVALYRIGETLFWRCLAYAAIFHFIRQQYGWVALYRRKAGETRGWFVDAVAIYASTLYPLLYWHTHLPRRFDWFIPGDVLPLPQAVDGVGRVLYVAALGAYFVRSTVLRVAYGRSNLGKDVVVLTTAVAWLVGVVLMNSDFAFTATNVLLHGLPYFAIVFFRTKTETPSGRQRPRPLWVFFGLLWSIAYVEELLWDRTVWQEREWLFGSSWSIGDLKGLIVPLLALPQLTHYVLDGFIWRRGHLAKA